MRISERWENLSVWAKVAVIVVAALIVYLISWPFIFSTTTARADTLWDARTFSTATYVEYGSTSRYVSAPDAAGAAAVAAGGRCKEITNRRFNLNSFGKVLWEIRLVTTWCYNSKHQIVKMYPAGTYARVSQLGKLGGWTVAKISKYRANCYGTGVGGEHCAWTNTFKFEAKPVKFGIVVREELWCATNQVRGDGRHYRHGSCNLGPWSGSHYG